MKREKKETRIEVADFETTTYKGIEFTEVWSAATVQIGSEDVQVFHSIGDLFDYYCMLDENLVVYFHNLKFDGQFILYYLSEVLHYEQAVDFAHNKIEEDDFKFCKRYRMPEKTYQYLISDKNQWYSILVKINRHIIEFRDSYKLLPFSVKSIGKAFNTKHKKLDMEYEGFRYSGCNITDQEMEYIKNDVLVVKEALEFMFAQGHTKMTIGACCLSEFKALCLSYDVYFPNLYEMPIDEEHDAKTAGDYILKSYRGGWCYLDKARAGKIARNGTTADVNSLYPSMMSSESGNMFPTATPTFWTGNFIPEKATDGEHYFFVRVRCRFYLKKGMLPFIQIKRCTLYDGRESLATSDFIDKTGKHHKFCKIGDTVIDTKQTMTMTMTDYYLFLEHYDVEEFEILDGCYFWGEVGIFDDYINRYKKIKLESKGALRTLAKLFLNNLYGKLAATTNSSFKVCYTKDDGVLGYIPVEEHDKTPGYIACGSAITSYARNFTIRAAQQNYHSGKRGFIYADTDSIHCDLKPEEIKGIKVHDKDFCCWKLESCWDEAFFVRQKTYIEHVTHEDLKPIEEPYHSIKCAGMTNHCKHLFQLALEGNYIKEGYIEEPERRWNDEADGIAEEGNVKLWTEEELAFLFDDDGHQIRKSYADFNLGLTIPGQLKARTIRGGVVLFNDYYTMR